MNTSAANLLTLSDGLIMALPRDITNTFAVDRDYRTPYAGTWNASIQHEFGGGFFAEAGYLGTKGTRLDIRSLPNEPPPGSPRTLGQGNQFGNAVAVPVVEAVARYMEPYLERMLEIDRDPSRQRKVA